MNAVERAAEVTLRNVAVEVADLLCPPDFVSNPSRNAWEIDRTEEILRERLLGLLLSDADRNVLAIVDEMLADPQPTMAPRYRTRLAPLRARRETQ